VTAIDTPAIDTARRTLRTADDASTFENTAESNRVSPTQLWIIFGQLGVFFCFFFGFGAQNLSPKKVALGAVVFTGACIMLAPHGRFRRIVFSLPLIGIMWWWLLSWFWAFNLSGWSIATQASVPLTVCMVLLAGVLPFRHFIRGVLWQVHFTIWFQYFWTATHYGSSTANYDQISGNISAPGWRGSFVHKNTMGPYLVMAVITVLVFERRTWLRRVAFAGAALLIVLSQSATSLSTLMVVLVMKCWLDRFVVQRGRMRPAFVLLTVFVFVVTAAVGILLFPMIVNLYGKDLTFTGRTGIWAASMRVIALRPWTGYGMGGVWVNPAAQPTKSIIDQLGFIVFHAHNGYVEIMLQLGVVGLALWAMLPLATIVVGSRLLKSSYRIGQWVLLFAIAVLMVSISEVLIYGAWTAVLGLMHAVAQREARSIQPWDHDLEPSSTSPPTESVQPVALVQTVEPGSPIESAGKVLAQ
jgi:O-antigen ligase